MIVGADTLVEAGGQILEKPADRVDARRILEKLSGARHRVITGICLWPSEEGRQPLTAAETTWVTMKPMAADEIEAYVESGEADGKAGAYAIQETGDRFVESFEGSFQNIVGFPIERFEKLWPECLVQWGWRSGRS